MGMGGRYSREWSGTGIPAHPWSILVTNQGISHGIRKSSLQSSCTAKCTLRFISNEMFHIHPTSAPVIFPPCVFKYLSASTRKTLFTEIFWGEEISAVAFLQKPYAHVVPIISISILIRNINRKCWKFRISEIKVVLFEICQYKVLSWNIEQLPSSMSSNLSNKSFSALVHLPR